MTLTRFLTAYIYNPIVLSLTRRRAARGLKGVGGRNTTLGSFLQLLAGPTIFVMFVSGLWHGAGYLFILWGSLHGVYLVINHAWRTLIPKVWRHSDSYQRIMPPVGWLLTFLTVSLTMVLFRSSSIPAAMNILAGALGLHGISIPDELWAKLGPLRDVATMLTTVHVAGSVSSVAKGVLWTGALSGFALLLPNTLELMRYEGPAVDYGTRAERHFGLARGLCWQPSILWAGFVAALALSAAYQLGGRSEFLYWQF